MRTLKRETATAVQVWRRLACLLIAALAALVSPLTAGVDAASPYPVPEVVKIEFTLPPTVLTSGTQNFECLARTDYSSGTTVPARTICYNTAVPGTPIPPTSYHAVDHSEFNGILFPDGEFFAAVIPCLYFPQLTPPTALRVTMDAQLNKAGSAVSGTVTVLQNTGPDVEFIYCADGTETTGDLTLTPLLDTDDTDGDGCSDYEELAPLGTGSPEGPDGPGKKGDARDPFNPYDFYDVDGDKAVTIQNDIVPVIGRFQTPLVNPNPDTGLSYDPIYDRGPSALVGPYHWNRPGPDNIITLQDDILGVQLQYAHTCAAAP